MPVNKLLTLTLLTLLAALAGCRATPRHAPPAADPVAIDAARYDQVFHAAHDVLVDFGFRVDREDYRFGRVTSHPLGSPTILEPWRPQNTTVLQALESTLANVRRTVTVAIDPLDPAVEKELDLLAAALSSPQDNVADSQPGTAYPGADVPAGVPAEEETSPPVTRYLLRVHVMTENRQIPVRRLTMGSRRERYANLTRVPAEWQARGITRGTYWMPTGHDEQLERRLLVAIMRRAEVNAADQAHP